MDIIMAWSLYTTEVQHDNQVYNAYNPYIIGDRIGI